MHSTFTDFGRRLEHFLEHQNRADLEIRNSGISFSIASNKRPSPLTTSIVESSPRFTLISGSVLKFEMDLLYWEFSGKGIDVYLDRSESCLTCNYADTLLPGFIIDPSKKN